MPRSVITKQSKSECFFSVTTRNDNVFVQGYENSLAHDNPLFPLAYLNLGKCDLNIIVPHELHIIFISPFSSTRILKPKLIIS